MCDKYQSEFFTFTHCDNCNSEIVKEDAHVVTKYVHAGAVSFHFCGETCACEYYLDKLRESGI